METLPEHPYGYEEQGSIPLEHEPSLICHSARMERLLKELSSFQNSESMDDDLKDSLYELEDDDDDDSKDESDDRSYTTLIDKLMNRCCATNKTTQPVVADKEEESVGDIDLSDDAIANHLRALTGQRKPLSILGSRICKPEDVSDTEAMSETEEDEEDDYEGSTGPEEEDESDDETDIQSTACTDLEEIMKKLGVDRKDTSDDTDYLEHKKWLENISRQGTIDYVTSPQSYACQKQRLAGLAAEIMEEADDISTVVYESMPQEIMYYEQNMKELEKQTQKAQRIISIISGEEVENESMTNPSPQRPAIQKSLWADRKVEKTTTSPEPDVAALKETLTEKNVQVVKETRDNPPEEKAKEPSTVNSEEMTPNQSQSNQQQPKLPMPTQTTEKSSETPKEGKNETEPQVVSQHHKAEPSKQHIKQKNSEQVFQSTSRKIVIPPGYPPYPGYGPRWPWHPFSPDAPEGYREHYMRYMGRLYQEYMQHLEELSKENQQTHQKEVSNRTKDTPKNANRPRPRNTKTIPQKMEPKVENKTQRSAPAIRNTMDAKAASPVPSTRNKQKRSVAPKADQQIHSKGNKSSEAMKVGKVHSKAKGKTGKKVVVMSKKNASKLAAQKRNQKKVAAEKKTGNTTGRPPADFPEPVEQGCACVIL
jgi:hypothetical protein